MSVEKEIANCSADVDIQTEATVLWTKFDEKVLLRKIDLRIFPPLIVLFILNFIDRNNFANARLYGLQEDLGLSDVEYQTCISILLVGYVSMQVPSNMFLNYITRPSLYLCTCVVLWGMISAATAAAHNSTGAIFCRLILGVLEAALFPGSLYYLSRWYTRKEMQLRVTLLNAGNLLAQAFGGLIAAGVLGNMEGKLGIRAWRWLFIIEGVVTVVIGIIAFPILPDYPTTTKWLSEKEVLIAEQRLVNDAGLADSEDVDEGIFYGLKLALTDPKVWLLALAYHTTIMGLSFSYFFPTITQALGYTKVKTLLLTAPPWIWALFVSIPNAIHADKTGERFFHYAWPAAACCIGFIISIASHNTGARYFSAFLMTTGYASGFAMLAWISNTIPRPRAKRAAAIGLVNACGNIGSIPGAYIWPINYGPYYRNSFIASLAILTFAISAACALRTYLKHLNKKLDRNEGVAFVASQGAVERSAKLEGETLNQVKDRMQRFRYLY
ncbi:related to nicotinamide mononucleotide permease [Phialocephala subalpina]|uniref:Related to nicotinamide mononucleotide permease n=1 Tax=Phialocephala subalpina TaxID=576137 RepID=A0A1L7XL11_9HELO|nr:related to nicotinamide mononucleotide permease [Phialocephala subalpina]